MNDNIKSIFDQLAHAMQIQQEPLRRLILDHLQRIERYFRDRLFDEMTSLSQAYAGVIWEPKLEFAIWEMVLTKRGSLRKGSVPLERINQLDALAHAANGWWRIEGNTRTFVPLSEWKLLYQAAVHG